MARISNDRYELFSTLADGTTDARNLENATLDITVSDDSADNDFELTLANTDWLPEIGACIYVDGTEIGGEVEGRGSDSEAGTATIVGRSWSGLLDARVIEPPVGADYYTYNGDARAVIRGVLTACNLTDNFAVVEGSCGTRLQGQFDRYTTVWEGLRKALKTGSLRLSATWSGTHWVLDAVPVIEHVVDAAKARITSDGGLKAINHLICGGKGDLAAREILHLYADANGKVSQTQTLKGKLEREAFYDYSNKEGEKLRESGIEKLRECQEVPTLNVDLATVDVAAHVGDIVTITDNESNTEVSAEISRVILKIEDGYLTTSVEGGSTRSTRTVGGSSGGSTSGGGVVYKAGEGIKIELSTISADVTQPKLDAVDAKATQAIAGVSNATAAARAAAQSAQEAAAAAEEASTEAQAATTAASNATTIANSARTTANSAVTKANQAIIQAQTATTTAEEAKQIAEEAKQIAQDAATGGFLVAHPVGSLYETTSSTSPAVTFGGKWIRHIGERGYVYERVLDE